jgi:hypothetical protein
VLLRLPQLLLEKSREHCWDHNNIDDVVVVGDKDFVPSRLTMETQHGCDSRRMVTVVRRVVVVVAVNVVVVVETGALACCC